MDLATVGGAVRAAYHCHTELDMDGRPHSAHCFRVAGRVRRMGGTEDQIICALAHDLLEDTDLDAVDLLKMGLSPDNLRTVIALTRVKGESDRDYIGRAVQSPDAVVVKIADVLDNLDPDRVRHLPPGRRERSGVRKRRDLAVLLAARYPE